MAFCALCMSHGVFIANRKENLMRQVALLVLGCVCGVFLYDRVSGPHAATLRAAQASGSASQTPVSGETRLQKLQHYQAASQLLETELAKYQELRKAELKHMTPDVYDSFRTKLAPELQETWDRMKDGKKGYAWEQKRKTMDEYEKERKNREMLDVQVKAYYQALLDARTDDAKKWEKQFEDRPTEKEIHVEADLIALLTRERDGARAALTHD